MIYSPNLLVEYIQAIVYLEFAIIFGTTHKWQNSAVFWQFIDSSKIILNFDNKKALTLYENSLAQRFMRLFKLLSESRKNDCKTAERAFTKRNMCRFMYTKLVKLVSDVL